MKKYIILTLIGLSILTAKAQSTNITIQGWLGVAGDWVGNVNTNLHYQDALMWTGPVYQNNINFANELGASLNLWKPSTNGIFLATESRTRTAGVAGTFVSEGVGLELGYQKYDIKLGLFVDGVYRFHTTDAATSKTAGEIGLFIDKMVSSVSAVGIFASYQTQQNYPILGGKLSVTFGNGSGFLGLL